MPTNAWKTGTPYAQLRRYTFWSFVLLGSLPVIVCLLILDEVEPAEFPWMIGFTVSVAGLAALATTTGWNLTLSELGERPRKRWMAWALIPAAAITIALAFPAAPPNQEPGMWGTSLLVLLAVSLVVMAISPGVQWYWSSVLIAAGAVAVAIAWQVSAQMLPSPPPVEWAGWSAAMISSAFILSGVAVSLRMSVWMVDRVREQEEASSIRADLAVAEERLRFSRDLHDIFGRTLTAVALKADLSAELAEAGHAERAATEMREVHRLSEDALREVRAVVAGYREIDLATEAAGARALLQSAGVRVRLIGNPDAVPAAHASALAWVVREGVTNVLRHSAATTCTLDLQADDDGTSRIVITNDGARSPESAGSIHASGSGLRGLADRLHPLGGSVDHKVEGDTFTLRAEVPREVRS